MADQRTTSDIRGETVSEHIDQPDIDDVEGHFQVIDGEGRPEVPPVRRPAVTEDDDVEGHVLDLDIERKR
jgi:hypothetical protein